MEEPWRNNNRGYKSFFSGKEDKHERGVGILVHKVIVNIVMGCRPVSSRHIPIRVRAVPFNITINKTGKAFADPSAMTKQMRLVS